MELINKYQVLYTPHPEHSDFTVRLASLLAVGRIVQFLYGLSGLALQPNGS
jgi:hypothetical protein